MTHILVVNPSQELEPLTRRLSEDGYRLQALPGTASLQDAVCQDVPDLILVDVANSNEATVSDCRRIKNDTKTEHTPIVFIATASQPDTDEQARQPEAVVNDWIVFEGEESVPEVVSRLELSLHFKQSLDKMYTLCEQLNEMNTELYERNMQVEKELYVARQLQQSLLPSYIKDEASAGPQQLTKRHYDNESLKISGLYLPCDALGGDLYDVIEFGDHSIGISITDVSGHGVPAGFITAIFKASFYRMTHLHEAPGEVFYGLNNELVNIVTTGDYVTGVYMRLKPGEKTHHLSYTGAGHPYPIHYHGATGEVSRLCENGSPLVWFPDMPYPTGEVDLLPGDKILVFTDGITELRNPKKDLFGEPALEELFREMIRQDPENILDRIVAALSDYTEGHPLEDDMSMVLIEAR